MESVSTDVRRLFSLAMRKAFPKIPVQEAIITPSKFGDYQCNNAMGIAKAHGKDLGLAAPKMVGEAIANALPENDVLDKVTVAPAGFVTVTVKSSFLESKVVKQVIEAAKVEFKDKEAKKVCVDFSSPNIAKEMHVGHLRSTIIGESICRILEMSGHEVLRLNHVGDWGTQFGMLIEYMKEKYPDFQTNMPVLSDLQTFYKAAKARFDEDADFKLRSQKMVVQLQSGDEFALNAWRMICEISRLSFNEIYNRLDVKVEERGESYYNEMIAPLVKELTERGIVEESKGAQCIFTSVDQVPLMVVKGDGGYGYDSTDMACIFHRLFVERADWVVYVTDLGQESHFLKIFDAAKQAGWHREPLTRLDHVGFGVVQGEDGKKFKTRSGTVTKLSDLLDEAAERAENELRRRAEEMGQGDMKLSPEEFKAAAAKMGYAAIKYCDLKQNRTTNYRFSFDKMLANTGNTAVYLLYGYARMCGIQRKSGKDIKKLDASKLRITHDAERDLLFGILRFPETIEKILADLHLHSLAEYMYELSGLLTNFYTNCKVVDSPEEESRLLIVEAVRKVMERCFFLLGIEPLERI